MKQGSTARIRLTSPRRSPKTLSRGRLPLKRVWLARYDCFPPGETIKESEAESYKAWTLVSSKPCKEKIRQMTEDNSACTFIDYDCLHLGMHATRSSACAWVDRAARFRVRRRAEDWHMEVLRFSLLMPKKRVRRGGAFLRQNQVI